MVILEVGQVVYIFIDNDVQVVGLVVGGNVGSGEALRHGYEGNVESREEQYWNQRVLQRGQCRRLRIIMAGRSGHRFLSHASRAPPRTHVGRRDI